MWERLIDTFIPVSEPRLGFDSSTGKTVIEMDRFTLSRAYGDHVVAAARQQWPRWQRTYGARLPLLMEVDDPAAVDEMRRGDPAQADLALQAMARLASIDGFNETAAAAFLAWLLRPGATHLVQTLHRQGVPIHRANRVVASALWVEVRTVRVDSHRVAANVLYRTRRRALAEVRTDWARREITVPQFADGLTPLWAPEPQDAGDRIAQLGAAALAAGTMSPRDWQVLELLLQVGAAAEAHTSQRALGGLTNSAAVHAVADRLSISNRTVFRRANNAVAGLKVAAAGIGG